MSMGYDGYAAVFEETTRTARKPHVCCACGRRIDPGQVYGRTASLYDGGWTVWKRCGGCEGIYQHLLCVLGDDLDDAPSPALDCGHEYEELHDRLPPEHIAALAFWVPGDPIPTGGEQ